jgi:hypothetical protein
LAPILDSALQQAVSNANLKAIHDLIRFIVEGYFGNDKDSSCRQNLQISIANCVKSALRDARWSVLVELLESLLMSVENNNRLDFIE